MQIYVRKSGFLGNIGFGLVSIADGLLRVLSIGVLDSNLVILYAKTLAKRRFAKRISETCPCKNST